MCDFDPPQVIVEHIRRARKPHRCYECSVAIQPGTRYVHIHGVWDHSGADYRFCVACDALHGLVQRQDAHGCSAPFGFLGDAVETSQSPALLEKLRAIREAAARGTT